MEQPPHGVVEQSGVRERQVATLVGKHPHPGVEEALHPRVARPQRAADISVVDKGDVGVGEVHRRRHQHHVADGVVHRLSVASFVAVGGDRLQDVLDQEVGHFELIAVGVGGY